MSAPCPWPREPRRRLPWGAILILAGAICAGFGIGRASASERPPPSRQWAIERCVGDQCEVLGWRYSGPTSCAVDAASARIGRQQQAGTRLVCVKAKGER